MAGPAAPPALHPGDILTARSPLKLPSRVVHLLPAGALGLGLLAGGVTLHRVPALLALVAIGAMSWWSERKDEVVLGRRAEAAVVVALTAVVLAAALRLPSGAEPLGRDWYRYLGNAVAVGEHDWKLYHPWRAPLHAWVSAWLAPHVSGGLVAASRAVSIVAITACLPLSWWLGRMLLGQWPALFGLALLTAWPDLGLLAQLNTPYPLLAALFVLGSALVGAALTRHAAWSIPAGLVLGLTIATDLRGWAMGAALGVGIGVAGVVQPVLRRRAAAVLLVSASLAAGTGLAVLSQLPVDLVPLREQVALQRNLNAAEGPRGCGGQNGTDLRPGDFFTPCAKLTLQTNIARAEASLPYGLAFFAVLAALGLKRRRDPSGWGPVLLVLPALTLVPSALIVGVQHRYALPFVPLGAMLGGAGLADMADRVGRRPWLGKGAVAAFVATLAAGWWTWPGTILAHAEGRGTTTPIVRAVLGWAERPNAQLASTLREQVASGDTVVDCARLALRQSMYPFPVEDSYRKGKRGSLSQRCASLMVNGPTGPGTFWLVLPGGTADVPHADWQPIMRVGDGIQLLKGTR